MSMLNRRDFVKAGIVALGAASTPPSLWAAQQALLPTVRWGKHEITRLLLGHNPLKGVSHQTEKLSREMKDYFESDSRRGMQLMSRCMELGINAIQMGFRPSERLIQKLISDFKTQGGQFHWIATFYSLPQDQAVAKKELQCLLQMDPRPIGVQQVGNTTDLLMKQGQLDRSQANLELFREAGLLVGLGSHNHEVIEQVENKGWDVDFYQCCFYRSVFGLRAAAGAGESFEATDREAMTRTIRQVPKPCIAFKVLGAGRHCQSPQATEAALRYAYQNIKSTDVVLVGMWQKHQDQVAENVALARQILGKT